MTSKQIERPFKKLEERQQLWNEGRIDELMRENRIIQSLVNSTNRTQEDSSCNFVKPMW